MPHSDLHKHKKSKNYLVLAIIFGICVLIWAVTLIKIDRANAGEIKSVGNATTYQLNEHSAMPAYDIYTRQLQYAKEARKFRDQIQRRSVNYSKPSAQLWAKYKQDLAAYHDTITEENIPSYFATWEDVE